MSERPKVRIVVTQALIYEADASGLQGSRCNPETCPVNRAAEAAFGPDVGCRTMRPYIIVGDSEVIAWMPRDVQDRIYRYDLGHGMEPFEFEIDDPRK